MRGQIGDADYNKAMSVHIGVARIFLLISKDDSEQVRKN